MKLQRPARISINPYLLTAFAIPFVGMLLVLLFANLFSSSTLTMLYSDCFHQYYPFFKAFRKALLSGESLLYSWNVGMGMDYLGLIAYYLASPLNLFSVLIPESWTLGYFSLLMPVKLGLAALFFALLLKKVFKRNDLSLSLFGGFYALCAWALGYQWNIMWLDTFALLPLVILGMLRLLQQRKFILYTLTLFLAVAANYYVGFFVCIFVLLTFICYQICRWQGIKRFLIDLLLMAGFSLLAIGMTAFLTLPALSALQSTYSSVNKFPEGFRLNIADENSWKGLLQAMGQVAGNMNGGITPTFKEGLPNLYCGIGTNLLAILFLTCPQVKVRDKLCSVGLLIFFNLSFVLRQLDYIWHGFHFTNMIPYRFSFLYSFVLLYMAYRAWLHRRSFRKWQIGLAALVALALVCCSSEMTPFIDLISGKKHLLPWNGEANIQYNLETIFSACTYVAYNLLFLIGYGAGLLYICKSPAPEKKTRRPSWLRQIRGKRRTATWVVRGTMGLELALILVLFGVSFSFTNVDNYPKGTQDTALAIDYMEKAETDSLFYRAETAKYQTLNDGALNGYRGVSTFTSSANVKATEFMVDLGFAARNNYNRYCYENGSPVANLFLNLKYMIYREGAPRSNAYFDDVFSSGNTHLLENNAYLPLGFLADAQILNVDLDAGEDPFQLQNALMAGASGVEEQCWNLLVDNQVTIHGNDLTLTAQNRTGYCNYETGSARGTVTYQFTAHREGLLCFHVEQSKRNSLSVYLNDMEGPLFTRSYSLPQTHSVCTVRPGDVVKIEFDCSPDQSGNISVNAAILDEAVFRQGYRRLNASTLQLTQFRNTYVEGTIQCNRDGVLYTSIPQDGNWTATVDGKPAQLLLIGDVMAGLNLSEGQHTVTFTYKNKAFSLGWKVSLGCLAVLAAVTLLRCRPLRKKKGLYEK